MVKSAHDALVDGACNAIDLVYDDASVRRSAKFDSLEAIVNHIIQVQGKLDTDMEQEKDHAFIAKLCA